MPPTTAARRYTTRSQSSSSSSPVTAHTYSYDGSDVYAEDNDRRSDAAQAAAQAAPPAAPARRVNSSRRTRPRSGTNDSGESSGSNGNSSSANDDENEDEHEHEHDGDDDDDTSLDRSALSGVSTRLEDEDSMYDATPNEVHMRAWDLIRSGPTSTAQLTSKITIDDIPSRVAAGAADQTTSSSTTTTTSKQLGQQDQDEAVEFLRQCVAQLDETDWQYSTPRVFQTSTADQIATKSNKATTLTPGWNEFSNREDELAATQTSWLNDNVQLATADDLRLLLLGEQDASRTTTASRAPLARTAAATAEFQTDGDSDNHTVIEMEDQSGSTLDFQDQAHEMAY
ncbi:hypothetical protein ACM66B_001500 [Microbotryomycetes sp. NB124-2]